MSFRLRVTIALTVHVIAFASAHADPASACTGLPDTRWCDPVDQCGFGKECAPNEDCVESLFPKQGDFCTFFQEEPATAPTFGAPKDGWNERWCEPVPTVPFCDPVACAARAEGYICEFSASSWKVVKYAGFDPDGRKYERRYGRCNFGGSCEGGATCPAESECRVLEYDQGPCLSGDGYDCGNEPNEPDRCDLCGRRVTVEYTCVPIRRVCEADAECPRGWFCVRRDDDSESVCVPPSDYAQRTWPGEGVPVAEYVPSCGSTGGTAGTGDGNETDQSSTPNADGRVDFEGTAGELEQVKNSAEASGCNGTDGSGAGAGPVGFVTLAAVLLALRRRARWRAGPLRRNLPLIVLVCGFIGALYGVAPAWAADPPGPLFEYCDPASQCGIGFECQPDEDCVEENVEWRNYTVCYSDPDFDPWDPNTGGVGYEDSPDSRQGDTGTADDASGTATDASESDTGTSAPEVPPTWNKRSCRKVSFTPSCDPAECAARGAGFGCAASESEPDYRVVKYAAIDPDGTRRPKDDGKYCAFGGTCPDKCAPEAECRMYVGDFGITCGDAINYPENLPYLNCTDCGTVIYVRTLCAPRIIDCQSDADCPHGWLCDAPNADGKKWCAVVLKPEPHESLLRAGEGEIYSNDVLADWYACRQETAGVDTSDTTTDDAETQPSGDAGATPSDDAGTDPSGGADAGGVTESAAGVTDNLPADRVETSTGCRGSHGGAGPAGLATLAAVLLALRRRSRRRSA